MTVEVNVAGALRSAARLADIALGLTHPVDAGYWRDKARARLQALDEDEPVYGLLDHEEMERDRLRELLGADVDQRAAEPPLGVRALLIVGLLVSTWMVVSLPVRA